MKFVQFESIPCSLLPGLLVPKLIGVTKPYYPIHFMYKHFCAFSNSIQALKYLHMEPTVVVDGAPSPDVVALIKLTGSPVEKNLSSVLKDPSLFRLEQDFEVVVAQLNALKAQNPPNNKAIKAKEVSEKSVSAAITWEFRVPKP